MMQQVELAACEEPGRVAKISSVFIKKLLPHVMERLEKEVRDNYFRQGANELQQVSRDITYNTVFTVFST